jgi:hypothetical protein
MTFNIQFDYRFDKEGFFNDPIRKNVLEQAANIWESYLNDDFAPILTGTTVSVPIADSYGDLGLGGFPSFGGPTQETVTLNQPIDDLLIFAYSIHIPWWTYSNVLGYGGSFEQSTVGSEQDIRYNGEKFQPWVGTILFNSGDLTQTQSGETFFFDTTPQTNYDIPKDQYDFLSIALHEIGHVLGIGQAPVFKRQITGQGFNGLISQSLNGGKPIPLESDLKHIKEGFTLSGSTEDLMDPMLTGTRQLPSPLDIAILGDIGYDIKTSYLHLRDKLTTPFIRFQNTDKPGTYLFAGEQEAASIRQNYKGFKEEGIAFQVAVNKDDPLMQPFYRFQNTTKGREGTYLFAGEQEAISIRQNYKNFKEEGLAFYAYSAGVGGGTTDFARFQNKGLPGTYLFTGPSETSSVMNNSGFTLEGSAFAAAG